MRLFLSHLLTYLLKPGPKFISIWLLWLLEQCTVLATQSSTESLCTDVCDACMDNCFQSLNIQTFTHNHTNSHIFKHTQICYSSDNLYVHTHSSPFLGHPKVPLFPWGSRPHQTSLTRTSKSGQIPDTRGRGSHAPNVWLTSARYGWPRHVTSLHVTSRHVTLRHVTSRHVTSRHVTSQYRDNDMMTTWKLDSGLQEQTTVSPRHKHSARLQIVSAPLNTLDPASRTASRSSSSGDCILCHSSQPHHSPWLAGVTRLPCHWWFPHHRLITSRQDSRCLVTLPPPSLGITPNYFLFFPWSGEWRSGVCCCPQLSLYWAGGPGRDTGIQPVQGILYCTVLYCTVLYCTVLYCTVLYCTVLHRYTDIAILGIQYSTVLYWYTDITILGIQYCTVLYWYTDSYVLDIEYCTVLYWGYCTVL